jgi:hypothetical protein
MNQTELNRIALNYIQLQSGEIASKITGVLREDLHKRTTELNGPTIHHMHNEALFHSLVTLNSLSLAENRSKDAVHEFCSLAESLKPKFMEIVEALKDFQPSSETSNNE